MAVTSETGALTICNEKVKEVFKYEFLNNRFYHCGVSKVSMSNILKPR